MKKYARDYQKNFVDLLHAVEATDRQKNTIDTYQAIADTCRLVRRQAKSGGKLFFIGNGGSAAIASHMAIDFWKNGSIPALAFNDSSLLTCVSNDLGYSQVFAKPLAMFGCKDDILFAISSSGSSENILNAVRAAKKKNCRVVTFSGFKRLNPLRGLGEYNFYVPEQHYGLVETVHHYLCHLVLDTIIQKEIKVKK